MFFFCCCFFIRLTHDSDSAALLWTSLDTSCLSLRRFHLNFQQQNFVKCRLIKNKNRYCGQLFLKQIFSRDIRVSDWAQWVGSQWIALICSNLKVAVWLQKAFGNSSQSGYIPALVNWQEKQNICEIQLSHTVRVHVLQLLWAQRAGISRLLWWRWIISCSSDRWGSVSPEGILLSCSLTKSAVCPDLPLLLRRQT